MSSDFNPYREWLSIPVSEQPANYYRLLGLPMFEPDPNVISNAADRQMTFIRTFQMGKYAQQSQQILNELAAARITLLDKRKKAEYDAKLRSTQKTGLHQIPSNNNQEDSLLDNNAKRSTPSPQTISHTPSILSSKPSNAPSAPIAEPPSTPSNTPSSPSRTPLLTPSLTLSVPSITPPSVACKTPSIPPITPPPPVPQIPPIPSATPPSEIPHIPPVPSSTPSSKKNEVPPLPSKRSKSVQQSSESKPSFLKKRWFAILISILVLPLIFYGSSLLLYHSKPSSQEAQSQEVQSQEVQSQEVQSQEVQSQEVQSQEVQSQEVQSQEVQLQEAQSQEVQSQEAQSQEAQSQETQLQEVQSQETQLVFESGVEPGDRKTITLNGVEFAFRWCPPGTFMMGSPKSEEGRYPREERHQVTLTKGFWMLETEVTQKQWQAIMGNNPNSIKGDNLPVSYLFWDSCYQDFCKKCAELGFLVALPTEAQWEYACRAGTSGAYAGALDEMAWYKDNSDMTIHPVGTKKANAWGLYDMYGNVEEWCQDGFGDYPAESVTDPVGALDVNHRRVLRGGAFDSQARACRSAFRIGYNQGYRQVNFGFRIITGQLLLEAEKSAASTPTAKPSPKPVVPNPSVSQPPKRINRASNADLQAGTRKVVTINNTEFAFRWCPPGTFMMGSPESEEARYNTEVQHKVTLTKGFWMMETEVTQKQWQAIMGNNPSTVKGDNLPVTFVSWDDCQEFCKKCKELGLKLQLPTEAQWEYACRAGSDTAFSWGNVLNGDKANCKGNEPYGTTEKGKYHQKEIPVGSYPPNAWGLLDMHGNVIEWCQDWHGNYPNDSVTDPKGPSEGSQRVNRGGSYIHTPKGCRSAYRGYSKPDAHISNVGVRFIRPITSLNQQPITEAN